MSKLQINVDVVFYYFHDGVLEKTDKWIEGSTHLMVTVVDGVPHGSEILHTEQDLYEQPWFDNSLN